MMQSKRPVFVRGLIGLMLMLVTAVAACSDPGLTVGELRGTDEVLVAQATGTADAGAERARTELGEYCDANPERCIVSGPEDAQVTLYEFSDYGCPACRSLNQLTLPQAEQEFGDQIRVVKLPAAILGPANGPPNTPRSPQAALCANEQGAGNEMNAGLFEMQIAGRDPSDDTIYELAEANSLDVDQFEACFDGEQYESAMVANTRLAEELGVRSTPTIFINGEAVRDANYPPLAELIRTNLEN